MRLGLKNDLFRISSGLNLNIENCFEKVDLRVFLRLTFILYVMLGPLPLCFGVFLSKSRWFRTAIQFVRDRCCCDALLIYDATWYDFLHIATRAENVSKEMNN